MDENQLTASAEAAQPKVSHVQQISSTEAYNLATNLMYSGLTAQQTIDSLVQKGVNAGDAAMMVETIARDVKAQHRSAGMKQVWIGVACLAAGFILTFAIHGFIFYGLMIYGVVRIAKGLSSMR